MDHEAGPDNQVFYFCISTLTFSGENGYLVSPYVTYAIFERVLTASISLGWSADGNVGQIQEDQELVRRHPVLLEAVG